MVNSWVSRLVYWSIIGLIGICLLWGNAEAILAQPLPTLEETAPSYLNLDTSTISSEKISQFVKAYLQVLSLIEQRQEELQAAETSLESKRLETEIQAEAFATIEEAGLTKQEYLQLLNLANLDSEFGERVAAQLQESQ